MTHFQLSPLIRVPTPSTRKQILQELKGEGCRGSEWVWRWKGVVVVVYVDGVGVSILGLAWLASNIIARRPKQKQPPTAASTTLDFFEKREITKTDRKIDGARIL